MKTLEMGPIAIADVGAWRPQRWTIAIVATIHLFVSAILLTVSPKVTEPPQVQSVEIVTLPDGTSAVVSRVIDPIVPDPTLPLPTVPTPSQNQAPDTPSAAQEQALTPNESVPAPVALPSDATNKPQEAESLPPIQPTESESQSDSEAAPVQFKPIPAPLPAPVTLRPTNRDILAAPTPDQITLSNKRLKAQEAAKLDPLKSLSIPEAQREEEEEEEVADAPYRPAPIPSLSPAQSAILKPAQAQILRPTQESTAPLNLPKSQIPLPKVQVPRVEAADLRISEPSQSADSASGAAGGTAGTGSQGQGGQTAAGGAAPAGVTSLGGSGFGGAAGSSSGSSRPAGGAGGASGAGASGPSGILPRRPGGAGVKQEFPTGQGDSLLGRMARTSECAQINRPRDAKCPNWDPIDGRRSRIIPAIPVAVPKDALPGRFEPGANPLPLCKPGTPQAQHGLSCLPSNDGPGIPKQ